MNAEDRRRLKILGILLPILGLSLWIGSTVSVSGPEAAVGDGRTGGIDPNTLRNLEIPEWLEPAEAGGGTGVDRDPFRYYPLPPRPQPRPQVTVTPPPVVTPPRPLPPPPPPIPFVYVGYGGVGESRAILWDDENELNRLVSEQDIVLGRYRVNRVTDSFVEIEDLQLGRTERLPIAVVE